MSEKTGWNPKRFDVAGAHPDEAWRAVADIAETVEELRNRVGGEHFRQFPEAIAQIRAWQSGKPLRFGNARDADVQQFLERGVKIVDGLEMKLPLGLSERQRQVRNRCDELAKSMEKVLAKRPDEPLPFDPWQRVKINSEPAVAKGPGQRALTAGETRSKYVTALRGHFELGPRQAARAKAAYLAWEETADRLDLEGPISDSAKRWKRFTQYIETAQARSAAKGEIWASVDPVDGIDFSRALTPRPAFKSKPRMRM